MPVQHFFLIHPVVSLFSLDQSDGGGLADMPTDIAIPRATQRLAMAEYTGKCNGSLKAELRLMFSFAKKVKISSMKNNSSYKEG